jgi:hypothetical protein
LIIISSGRPRFRLRFRLLVIDRHRIVEYLHALIPLKGAHDLDLGIVGLAIHTNVYELRREDLVTSGVDAQQLLVLLLDGEPPLVVVLVRILVLPGPVNEHSVLIDVVLAHGEVQRAGLTFGWHLQEDRLVLVEVEGEVRAGV